MRIESVRFDASGNPTIVVTGGISFFLPLPKALELVESLGRERGEPEGSAGMGPSRSSAEARAVLQGLPTRYADISLEDEIYQTMASIDEEYRARRKALELCARAEQSSAGLRAKLSAKGFSKRAAALAIQALADEDIVNDARYARVWARSRAARRACGPARLAAELRSRGQGEDAIRGALEDLDFSRALERAVLKEQSKLAARWRKKGIEPNARFKEELYRILKRQGFDPEKIQEKIKKM